jgi:hypothetical protein
MESHLAAHILDIVFQIPFADVFNFHLFLRIFEKQYTYFSFDLKSII